MCQYPCLFLPYEKVIAFEPGDGKRSHRFAPPCLQPPGGDIVLATGQDMNGQGKRRFVRVMDEAVAHAVIGPQGIERPAQHVRMGKASPLKRSGSRCDGAAQADSRSASGMRPPVRRWCTAMPQASSAPML